MKKFVVGLIVLFFAIFLYNELKVDNVDLLPNAPIKFEIVDSFIPGVKKYYICLDYKKFKVNRKSFDKWFEVLHRD